MASYIEITSIAADPRQQPTARRCRPRPLKRVQSERESLGLSIAVAFDGLQDAFDRFQEQGLIGGPGFEMETVSAAELKWVVEEMNAFFRPPIEEGNG